MADYRVLLERLDAWFARRRAGRRRAGAVSGRVQRVLSRPVRHFRRRRGADRAGGRSPPGCRAARGRASGRGAARADAGPRAWLVAALRRRRAGRGPVRSAHRGARRRAVPPARRRRHVPHLRRPAAGLPHDRIGHADARRPRDRERMPDPGPVPRLRRAAADAVRARGSSRKPSSSACARRRCGGSGTRSDPGSRRRSRRWWHPEGGRRAGGRAGPRVAQRTEDRYSVIPSAALGMTPFDIRDSPQHIRLPARPPALFTHSPSPTRRTAPRSPGTSRDSPAPTSAGRRAAGRPAAESPTARRDRVPGVEHPVAQRDERGDQLHRDARPETGTACRARSRAAAGLRHRAHHRPPEQCRRRHEHQWVTMWTSWFRIISS